MLPDEEWLVTDSDSEEEMLQGDETPDTDDPSATRLPRSQTEPAIGTAGSPATPSRLSRYGTYFHHPERRRQPIPGAFPH